MSSTTHKTLRGPRGGVILTNDLELGKRIDKIVFPGVQGGPLMHVIAAKAVAFYEALQPEFITYQKQVIANAKALANRLIELGYHVISNGTDNHLMLVDVKSKTKLTGKQAENILHSVNITVNKNSIPNDKEKPFITSGIRLGSPACTTRGFKEDDMILVADLIDKALLDQSENNLKEIKEKVLELTHKYPLSY